jgi:anti-anti-sigma factor
LSEKCLELKVTCIIYRVKFFNVPSYSESKGITKIVKSVMAQLLGFYSRKTIPIEGKMNNFQFRHHCGYLIASIQMQKATFQEAIEFKSLIDDEIENGFYNIIISLNDCEFIDSTFVGVLVVIWKKVRAKGGTLKLVKLGKFNHSVLHLTGAIEIFEKFDSIEEALASFITPIEQYSD